MIETSYVNRYVRISRVAANHIKWEKRIHKERMRRLATAVRAILWDQRVLDTITWGEGVLG